MISNQNALEHIQVDINPESNDNYDDTRPHIVENSNLDLESYSNNYTGLGRLYRLAFIADHCPSLRVEALKLAIGYVKKTYNVGLYQTLHNKLVEATTGSTCALPNIGDNGRGAGHEIPQLDQTWIEMRTKKAGLQAEKLDTDLKNYKSNSIKESIRRGYQDLGDHYLDCGDLNKAFKSYCGARDSCTSGKHAVNMFLNVIKVSLYLQNWAHVTSYVCKVEQTPDFAEDKDHDPVIFTRLRCAAGIAELACKRYKSAARHFLQASLDHCDFPEILSPSNVAVYGGLCALATYDRKELQKDVIFSSSFKLFLELEPQLREIIFKFYESKYATCLRLLEEIKDSLYLDMYIAPHVTTLYSQIRNRALVQYFSPYLSTDMRKMAAAFNTSVPSLEDELIQLILDGQIQARIDSHNRILYAKDIDRRSTTFKKALSMGQQYSKSSHMLVLRAAVVKHHIQVKD